MGVNIGTAAVNAVVELRGNRHFDELVGALGVIAQTRLLAAVGSDVAVRVDATAYAKGMYDLWAAMHAALTDTHPSQVKLPPLTNARTRERANV
jgi:hypothetical protein